MSTDAAQTDDVPRRGGILREGFDYDFSRADPATGSHVDPAWCALYETLTVADASGRIGPLLAADWTEGDDGLSWRFRVRTGVRFHSGDPCDAEAVADAMRMHNDPDDSPMNAFFWRPVKDVRAEGDAVVVELHHRCANLPALLRSWHAAIPNPRLRRALGDAYGRDGRLDGTGPFRFASWTPGEHFAIERWAGHAAPALLDGVRWVPLLDEADRAAALEAGAVDCVQNVSLLDVERLRANPDLAVISFQQSALVYLALDFEHDDLGFRDARVRRAVSVAIDRDALVADELGGHGWPQRGPIPSESPRHEPGVEACNAFDPDEARRLLDAAGFAPGPDGVRLTFEILVLQDATVRRVAARVRAMLAEVGVRVELRETEGFEGFYAALGAHPPAFLSKWFWPDPVNAIVGFVSSWSHAGPNWQRARDEDIDGACRAWQEAADEAALDAAASELQLLCAERLPLIPLVSPAAVWAHHRRVRGWRPNAADLYPRYDDVWLAP